MADVPIRLVITAVVLAHAAAAEEPEAAFAGLPAVIGEPRRELVLEGDTLLDIAWSHRLGFDRVARLNPGVDPWIPDPGTIVALPTEHVPPDAPRRDLVINVPEMQLYDFRVGPEPEVFAIAIGDQMDPSLVGEFRIGVRREHPSWHVPASIRAEKPELPAVVPPGPDNPLGDHWLTIGRTSYGIHGTNNRWSIGREATHGCIRLYNDEMARLYARTRSGTRLRLVYQSVKLGRRGRDIVVEAHPDVYGREGDRAAGALARLDQLGLGDFVRAGALRRAVEAARGTPVAVGRVPPPSGGMAPTPGAPPP